MILAPLALALELGAAKNADLLAAVPGNDAVCLKSPTRPSAPRTVSLPVGAAAQSVTVTFTTQGPVVHNTPLLYATLRFADGRSVLLRGQGGVQVSSVALPGRDARTVEVGERTATRWTMRTGRPDVVVTSVDVEIRGQTHDICILGLDAGDPEAPGERTDTRDWYPFLIGPLLDAPVPQALRIEAPAGARGAVSVGPDGHYHFADGTRARFWGVDVYWKWALPPKEEADRRAATLANLGFNMVRLHHIDEPEQGLVNRNRGQPGQPVLDPETADRLDFFLSRLKAHGIYLFMEIATARVLDASDGVSDPGGAPSGFKLFTMWEDDWRDAYLRWFEALWGRTNPYTGLRYAEDPMVATLELANEHSLIVAWGGGLENVPSVHLDKLDARWNAWLGAKYGTDERVAAAWTGGIRPGLQRGETLGAIRRDPMAPYFSTSWSPARRDDLTAFYHELEDGFYTAVAEKARSLGFGAPIVPSISYGNASILRANTRFQVGDMHVEWDTPAGLVTLRNESLLANPSDQRMLENAYWAVEGQAYMVSELNHPFPNRFMSEAPWLWATMAAAQDWDGLVWNSFPVSGDEAGISWISDPFDLRNATVKLAQCPGASSAFRGGWLPAATGSLPLPWSREGASLTDVEGRANLPAEISEPMYWLAHRIRSVFDRPWPTARPGSPPDGVRWTTRAGTLVIDRPRVQARIGPPGTDQPSRLAVELSNFAAVSLTSLDGRPLTDGGPALLSVGTRQENTGMEFAMNGRYVRTWGVPPVMVEPARGSVRVAWARKPTASVLGPDGSPTGPLAVGAAGKGWWSLDLAAVRSPWIRLE
jgi:hypothetical protein